MINVKAELNCYNDFLFSWKGSFCADYLGLEIAKILSFVRQSMLLSWAGWRWRQNPL